MKIIRFLLAICALLSFLGFAKAGTIQAKVTEVYSGNTLAVSNTNRTLRVRVKGIAPPETGQSFSEAAREHLKLLVLNKVVAVDYNNLSEGYLEAKITLDGIDIASQMIRDGAAWYDRRFDYTLSATDRELYAHCEQSARYEKRGLWSDASPVAPWEFRKAKEAEAQKQAETKQSKPGNFSAYRAAVAQRAAANRMLSNKHFGRGNVQPGAVAGNPTIRLVAPKAAPEDWVNYKSDKPRFSIRVPGNSYFFEFPILTEDLRIVNLNYVVGLSDGALYTLMWTKGSSLVHATDNAIADAMMADWVKGINHYFEGERLPYRASYSSGRAIRLGNYSGKQYSVSAADFLAGFARIVSRRVGDQHEVFALAVFSRTGDESAFDFLNSLKFAEARK